ncbi:ROK family protein [Anaerovibrio sp.]|uniref:ROK family protein n=1 Tax=Anaerovibrio sp. TaxID=1872532 RepID=UPI003F174D2D
MDIVAILGFDVGGSSIKFSVMTEEGKILRKGSILTPDNLENFYSELIAAKEGLAASYELEGAAFSMPGAVDDESGVIGGASALPYIHDFNIKRALAEKLGMPVTMENDANCAALGEVWLGAAKYCQDVAFLVIGSGVGGAVVKGRRVHHGCHLHGGEFGFMVVDDKGTILSEAASTRALAERVAVAKGMDRNALNGKEVFELQANGDRLAVEAIEEMYDQLARAVYNLQYSLDPELFVFGGAISEREDFVENISRHLHGILEKVKIARVRPQVARAEFGNDANLIGAVYHFLQQKQ